MTTEAAAKLYEAKHMNDMEGRPIAIYNPQDTPFDELPVIYGFNNGGHDGWWQGLLIADDGTYLGEHICTNECYMTHDLGILEGTMSDRHEEFRRHYPDGYRMEFVGYGEVKKHEKLMTAINIAETKEIGRDKQVYLGPQGQKATILREDAANVTLLIKVESHEDEHQWTSTRKNFEARWKPFVSECEDSDSEFPFRIYGPGIYATKQPRYKTALDAHSDIPRYAHEQGQSPLVFSVYEDLPDGTWKLA